MTKTIATPVSAFASASPFASIHAQLGDLSFNLATSKKEDGKAKDSIGSLVSSIYRAIPAGDKTAFMAEFGDGKKASEKGASVGALQADLQAVADIRADAWLAEQLKTIKVKGEAKALLTNQFTAASAELAKLAYRQLSARKTECRQAFAKGVVVAENETVQTALRRASQPVKKGADQNKSAPAGTVTIADDATMDQIADALSIWVAKHGNATVGLAHALRDFLPISINRRKAA